MTTVVGNLIRGANRKPNDKLNILWFEYNGIFDAKFINTFSQHNYYGCPDEALMIYDKKMFPKTDNYYELSSITQLPLDVDFDCIVCNDIFGQFDKAKSLSSALHLPLVTIQHQLPNHIMKLEDISLFNEEKISSIEICTSNTIKENWFKSDAHVFPYYIPCYDKNIPNKDIDFTLVGKFIQRDLQSLQPILNSDININTIGLDDKSCSFEHLIKQLKRTKYIINVQNTSSAPMLMWLAMGCGCVPLTNLGVFTKGITLTKSCKSFKNMDELMVELKQLANASYNEVTSQQCIDYIKDRFSKEEFVKNYSTIFDQLSSYMYTVQ